MVMVSFRVRVELGLCLFESWGSVRVGGSVRSGGFVCGL